MCGAEDQGSGSTGMSNGYRETGASYSVLSPQSSVLIISTSRLHRPRAALIQTLYTVRALQEAGMRTELWMPPAKGDPDPILRAFGLSGAIGLRTTGLLHSRWRPWGYLPFILLMGRRLRRRPLFVRSPELSKSLVRAGIPHALEVHQTSRIKEELGIRWLRVGAEKGLLRPLVAISEAGKRALLSWGVPPEHTAVLHNGVDTRRFRRIPLVTRKALERPTILHMGTLSPSRGLRILGLVAKAVPCTVLQVGRIEGASEVPEGIRTFPPVPHHEVPGWYKKAGLILLPYQPEQENAECFSPMKLFEAMASGRPVIASRLGPIEEVLTHRKTALLVEPGDAGGWIEAVEELRRSPELGIELARRAREEAARYDWAERGRRLASLLQAAQADNRVLI